ncbi:MAG TPA: hypothetical protein VES64_08330, partial [Allosphingosinicella sp.]|nr:hypothetical protein [Allosphingosinicella sp.]
MFLLATNDTRRFGPRASLPGLRIVQGSPYRAAFEPKDRTMPKLSDTQTILLSAAANREGGSLLPPPDGLKARGAALDRTLNSLLRRGMISTVTTGVAEMAWKPRDADADDGAGGGTGLVITPAGFAALGLEPPAAEPSAKPPASDPEGGVAGTPVVAATTPRPGG